LLYSLLGAGTGETNMPVTPEDRPLDLLREETVDQLVMNYGHGRLSLDAFQRRLDRAFDAPDHAELIALTADLDLQVDPGYVEQKREELAVRYDYEAADEADDVDYLINILSGGDRGGEWIAASEIRVLNVMGGGDLDFTHARFSSRVTRVRVVCFCGGMDIFVPEGVSITVRTFNILGGVSNKAPSTLDPGAPRIIVEGLVMLGGLDVKVKKTLKERMLEFANGLRAMFGQSPQSG
jgi:hypothetical protein